MSDDKRQPARRSEEERRKRFGWTGDDVLHLQIDGADIKSTPPPKAD